MKLNPRGDPVWSTSCLSDEVGQIPAERAALTNQLSNCNESRSRFFAAAEVARPVRFLNVPLGAVVMAVPFIFGANTVTTVVSMALGAGLVFLSMRRGPIRERFGCWNRRDELARS